MIQQWSTVTEENTACIDFTLHIRNTDTALSINCPDRYFTQEPPGRTDKPFRTFIECSTITPLLLLRYRRIGQMNESVRPSRRAEEIGEAVNNCMSRSHGQQCRLYKRSRDSPTVRPLPSTGPVYHFVQTIAPTKFEVGCFERY